MEWCSVGDEAEAELSSLSGFQSPPLVVVFRLVGG